MSNLQDKLFMDLKEAMKNKDTLRKGVITMLRNGLQTIEKEEKRTATKEDELKVLRREIKQNQEAISDAEKGNRLDVIETLQAKIQIVESYLPKQMTEGEVKELLTTLPVDKSMKMGQVIGILQKAVDGRADNRLISTIAKEYLSI